MKFDYVNVSIQYYVSIDEENYTLLKGQKIVNDESVYTFTFPDKMEYTGNDKISFTTTQKFLTKEGNKEVIIKAILNVNVDGFTNVFETILANQNRFSNLIFIQPIDFLMIDVFGVILAVVVIFTGVLMERSYKKIGIILGGGYIFASIILYICLTAQYAQYVDILLKVQIAYYIVIFVISILISRTLLNKRIGL